MKIPCPLKFFLGFILLNLLMVFLGAIDFDFSEVPWVGTGLNYFARISGADGQYGFFAPGVDGQIRARFEVYGSTGLIQTLQLEDGQNSEADLRIGDIIEQFDHESDGDPLKFQRELSASLSAAVLARIKDAKSVTISLEEFKQISMSDYREGLRPKWNLVYTASFTQSETHQ
jgi:hypothetical protein